MDAECWILNERYGRPIIAPKTARPPIHHPKLKIQNHPTAFTLTELLVSMAILSGLIVLLFSVVDGTSTAWKQAEQRVDSFREARAALFIIARDLQTMVPAPDVVDESLASTAPNYAKPNGTPDFKYIFVYQNGDDLTLNPDVSFSSAATLATKGSSTQLGEGDRLFFLTAQPTAAQGGAAKSDVCSVGYYLDYTSATLQSGQKEMNGAQKNFKLYRYFTNSDTTFTNLKNYAAKTSTVLMQASSTTDEVLARNVIDFRIKAYDSNMASPTTWTATQTPLAVDISIKAYNYSTASRFFNRADWLDIKNTPALQTFTTRVYLPRK